MLSGLRRLLSKDPSKEKEVPIAAPEAPAPAEPAAEAPPPPARALRPAPSPQRQRAAPPKAPAAVPSRKVKHKTAAKAPARPAGAAPAPARPRTKATKAGAAPVGEWRRGLAAHLQQLRRQHAELEARFAALPRRGAEPAAAARPKPPPAPAAAARELRPAARRVRDVDAQRRQARAELHARRMQYKPAPLRAAAAGPPDEAAPAAPAAPLPPAHPLNPASAALRAAAREHRKRRLRAWSQTHASPPPAVGAAAPAEQGRPAWNERFGMGTPSTPAARPADAASVEPFGGAAELPVERVAVPTRAALAQQQAWGVLADLTLDDLLTRREGGCGGGGAAGRGADAEVGSPQANAAAAEPPAGEGDVRRRTEPPHAAGADAAAPDGRPRSDGGRRPGSSLGRPRHALFASKRDAGEGGAPPPKAVKWEVAI
jgi:hypothetical protein